MPEINGYDKFVLEGMGALVYGEADPPFYQTVPIPHKPMELITEYFRYSSGSPKRLSSDFWLQCLQILIINYFILFKYL